MLLGYNTNGLAHHDLRDAIELIASLGYRSIAITLDHATLNPYKPSHDRELKSIAALLDEHQLQSVVETGARFLLDSRNKHEPTLVSPRDAGRPRRVEFLRRAIDAAAALGSDCVSLWSGVAPRGTSRDTCMRRLVEGLHAVLDYAERRGVVLGFEPEPGMFIDTMESFAALQEQLGPSMLRLTLDVGHLHCLGETPIEKVVRKWGDQIVNVHIEDMRSGVHQHLMFGEGEMEFRPILRALVDAGYNGGLHVELSRHSHLGPQAAQRAFSFLQPLLKEVETDSME